MFVSRSLSCFKQFMIIYINNTQNCTTQQARYK
nr:MAG TPA: hypothetical protein [Caudoviricetes sp.]